MTVSTGRPVPARALVISLGSLLIPVLGVVVFPEWVQEEQGMLIWLTSLIPAFLLAYYRGLGGVALALAGAMALLALTQVAVLVLGVAPPDWKWLLAVVALCLAICIGLAVVAELLHRERRAAERMALMDPLTGLPNRRYAELTLDAQFAAAVRGHRLLVVLFDLDHFKGINDQHGHDAGDAALRAFADVLKRNTRRMNLSARFGGEEFISVLVDSDLERATVFANRVREQIQVVRFTWGGVTVSAGAAAYEDGMGSYEVLVGAADRALYTSKSAGRNRVSTAARALPEPAAAAPHPAPAAPAPPGPRTETVLVVDDDPDVLRSVGRILRKAGYRVEETANTEEVIERYRAGRDPVDLLVTDVIMPRMSGLTLVDHLVQLRPDVRVVYMSGYLQRTVPWSGLPGAFVGFVGKPIEVGEFLAVVRDVLATTTTGSGLTRTSGPTQQ